MKFLEVALRGSYRPMVFYRALKSLITGLAYKTPLGYTESIRNLYGLGSRLKGSRPGLFMANSMENQ